MDRPENNLKPRSAFIDVLKGIGIISIVLGHALNESVYKSEISGCLRRLLYDYHLVVFFFVVGLTYHTKPFQVFIKKAINNQYIKYVKYQLVTIALIPLFNAMGVIKHVDLQTIPARIVKALTLRGGGVLNAAMWFCTLYLLATVLYQAFGLIKREKVRFACICFAGVLGAVLTSLKVLSKGHINEAFLLQPVILFGEIFKRKNWLDRMVKPWLFIPLVFVMLFSNILTGYQVELSASKIYNGWLFYPISIIGILFCVSLAKAILRKDRICRIVARAGKYSYSIMALHLFAFKFFDYFLLKINCLDADLLPLFPISSPKYRIIYAIIGVIVPIWIGEWIEIAQNKMRGVKKLVKNQKMEN